MNIRNIFIPGHQSNEGSEKSNETEKFHEKTVNADSTNVEPKRIDESIQDELEKKSNENYDKIVSEIINVSKKHLDDQDERKKSMRKVFIWFFIILLSFQMLAVIIFITLSAIKTISFELTDFLLSSFIASVFVETLGGIIIMVTFAFGSKEEVEVVKLLTEVIKNYQKYNRHENK